MRCTACDSILQHREAISTSGYMNYACVGNNQQCPARRDFKYGCCAAVIPGTIDIGEYWLPFLIDDVCITLEGSIKRNILAVYLKKKPLPYYGAAVLSRPYEKLYDNEFFKNDAENLFNHLINEPELKRIIKLEKYSVIA